MTVKLITDLTDVDTLGATDQIIVRDPEENTIAKTKKTTLERLAVFIGQQVITGGTVQPGDTDLTAIAALTGTGNLVRTADAVWALRTMIGPAAGITITNGDAVAGNPTWALANDLAALEGLASTGFATRTATDTWAQRTITGTANEITFTNGDGVSGNPTASLPTAITLTGKTLTGGTFASPTLTTPALGTPASGVATNLTGTAAGLTAGNVTTNANLTGEVTSVGNAATLTNSAVIGKVLTGYTSGAGTVASTDTILQAIQKLNGNDATNANLTGDVTSVGNATTLTNAPVIAKVLTGYVSGAGTVSATDSILQAIQKLNGNDATNANLTGVITSVGNATSIASQTGTGTKFVVDTSPVLVTPNIGVATATSINGNTFTTGTYTLTGTAGKTFTFSNTLTLAGTDGTTMTFPTTSATLARTDAANTFTGHQTIEGVTSTGATGTGKLVFDTSPLLVTPNLGTPSAVVLTNASGTAASLTAGNVTTNANLTGQVTSVGNAATLDKTAITAQTLNNSPVAANDYITYYSASNNALQKATITNLISSGTAGVASFNSRTGAVSPTTGDYTVGQVTGAAASGANTDITSVLLNQTGLVVKGATSFALTIKPNETLTAGRTLNILTGDATRSMTFGGDWSSTGAVAFTGAVSTAGALTHAGAFSQTFTATATTSVTLPVSGTLLSNSVTATISKGYTLTPNSLGNITSFTIDPTLGNYQYGTNHGAATWTAPTSDCAVTILVTNDASAGAITFSGFTVGSSTGDSLTTTNTSKFLISIVRINSVSTYVIKALQ
jgi:hypothetical protein